MKRLTRAGMALGLVAGFVLVAAPPASAGIPTFEVTVTGEVVCLDTGEAEVTWTAVGSVVEEIDDTLVPVGLRPLGETSQAGVRFEGEQSGAATGPVQFDPEEQFVPASNSSFPVSSEAVAVVAGEGGTVTLDVVMTVFNPLDPEQAATTEGTGSVDLPECEQPTTTQATSGPTVAAVAAGTAAPRFTG